MDRRAFLHIGTAAAVLAAAGCASAPTNYYRLAVVPGAVNNGPVPRIGVRSISIPGYLNQNRISKSGENYELSTFADDVWAEPLDSMLQEIAVQEISQRLPSSVVLGSGGSIASGADLLIEANVLRFDPDSTGQITLTAQVALKSGQNYRLLTVQTFTSTATPSGADVTDAVATMSALWAGFVDQIASLCAEQWGRLSIDAASQ